MRYVPSFPPPVSSVDTNGVKPISHARPVRAVTQSVIPPVVFMHYRAAEEAGTEGRSAQAPAERRSRMDRRTVCRRIGKEHDKLLLLDSRAVMERRRNSRRVEDLRTSIDEEI